MVWFQCEDCGENLKKPKLSNHFRICSANKLSCIDCGEVFGQQIVQGHTQCITEAEKYGPKGQGKASNHTPAKSSNDSKQKPDVDVNVGLSERPPWFCSLCNTNATSKQTLMLHADGKKHRAKARAYHTANQQPKHTEESPNANLSTENNQKSTLSASEQLPNSQVHDNSAAESWSSKSIKKRKLEACENGSDEPGARGDIPAELGNGEVIQVEGTEMKELNPNVKKSKVNLTIEEAVELSSHLKDRQKKIKWKRMIASVLKQNPEGSLKMRKLRKLVLKALQESGFTEDENLLTNMLEQQINTSSRFSVDGKYVRLVSKT